MVEVSCERGLADATVARVVARAGVSRRTFYELFEDREECFLAAFDDALARVSDCVVPAYESGGGWAERLRLSLAALLSFLDVERGVGWLLVVGSLGAGPKALERRQRVLAQIITIVDAGRGERTRASAPPPLTAEGVVGAVFSVVHARMAGSSPPAGTRGHRVGSSEGDSPVPERGLLGLLNPLMGMVVLPYLGPAASRRELERPVPKTRARRGPAAGDPLRELEMRLTYRTVRVLLAVGEHPGASNKEVGEASGAQDQGQISKLLARLERLGLIHNDGRGPSVKGAPNSWALTERGLDVERAMSADTSPRGGR